MKHQPRTFLLAGALLFAPVLPMQAQSVPYVTNRLGLEEPKGKWTFHDSALLEDEHYVTDSNFSLAENELDSPTDEQLLRELQPHLDGASQAMKNRDRTWFDRNLADDYIHTNPAGEVTDKAHEIADMLSPAAHTFSLIEPILLATDRVRFYNGNTAVAPGQFRVTGTDHGQAFSMQVRSLATWIKRNGNWQMVAFQATSVAKRFEK